MGFHEKMEKMASNLRDLSIDLGKMIEEMSKESISEISPEDKERRQGRVGKSIQPLTKFYSSSSKARGASKMNPATKFVNDRLKEIYRG